MTNAWVRTSEQFSIDCSRARLSDAAYRTHHEALAWSADRRMDGLIPRGDVRRFAGSADYLAAVEELVASKFWSDEGESLRIVAHIDDQPTAVAVDQRKANQRRRARASRHPDYRKLRQEIDAGLHVCAECRAPKGLHVDHIIALEDGGEMEGHNLQVLCGRCNVRKGPHGPRSKAA